MNRKSFWAFFLVLAIPIICYLILNKSSEGVVVMPQRFFPDNVIETTRNGKTSYDTVWHKVSNLQLTNQLGQVVNLYDVKNKIIVLNFFFTHCPNICPQLTRNMVRLQKAFTNNNKQKINIEEPIVQFISLSIDPERDSVTVLKKYADRFGIQHDNWWLLTGSKKTIYDYSLNELKLGLIDGLGVDTSFIHSQKIVLIDKEHVIRGYYDGLDSTAIAKLAYDVGLLTLERNKKTKRKLF